MVESSHYSWYINWIWQSLKVFERILMRADVNGWALLNWPPRFSGLLVLAWQWCQKIEGGFDWSLYRILDTDWIGAYRILDLDWIKRWKCSVDWGGGEGKTKKIEQVKKIMILGYILARHDPGIYRIIYCIYCNILARRPWPWSGIFEHQKTLFRSAVEKREFGEDED